MSTVLDNGYAQLVLFFSPTILWWLFRPQSWKSSQEREGMLLFRVSTGWQLAGMLVFSSMTGVVIFWLLTKYSPHSWGPYVVMLVFAGAGLWSFGDQVTLTHEEVEKRTWWKTESVAWANVTDFLFLGAERWMIVAAIGDRIPRTQIRIVLTRQYVDFDRLLQEIISCVEAHVYDQTPPTSEPHSEIEQIDIDGSGSVQ